MWSGYQYTLPTPSEEYVEGTTACLNYPQSLECKNWNESLVQEAAVVGAGLAAIPLAIPGAATAAYVGASAYLTTLPASIQTAIALGGTIAGYAGATAGTVACVSDPYSEACLAYVAALQGDPMAMVELAKSADGLINRVNLLAKTNQANQTLYDFYSMGGVEEVYDTYTSSYGKAPSIIQTIKDPNDLYDFQKLGIKTANNPTNENIKNLLNTINSQEGVTLKVVNRTQMQEIAGSPNVAGVSVNHTESGFLGIGTKKTSTVYILDPTDTASIYNEVGNSVSKDEALLITIQKACHEAGHSCDFINIGLSDAWASEYRQKNFDAIFYDNIGQGGLAQEYQDLLEMMRINSTVTYIPGQ